MERRWSHWWLRQGVQGWQRQTVDVVGPPVGASAVVRAGASVVVPLVAPVVALVAVSACAAPIPVWSGPVSRTPVRRPVSSAVPPRAVCEFCQSCSDSYAAWSMNEPSNSTTT